MSVQIRDEKGHVSWWRPNYVHSASTWEQATAALIEDIRNTLELAAKSQMLQCDVREDIRRIRIALEKIARPKRRAKK
jgi:hypothetical protein